MEGGKQAHWSSRGEEGKRQRSQRQSIVAPGWRQRGAPAAAPPPPHKERQESHGQHKALLDLTPADEAPVLVHAAGQCNLLALLGAHRAGQLQLGQIVLDLLWVGNA